MLRAAAGGAAAVLLASALGGCGGSDAPADVTDPSPRSPTGRLPVARAGPGREYEIVTHVERDAIPAVDRPTYWSAEEAGARYGPDEGVIGVWLAGAARAYSIPFLSRHEIVNDVVGGRRIAVTWCPLSFTGIVFARPVIDGVELDFGVSGKLVMNNLVLYDRQTDSQWSQLLGEAVYGALRGQVLEMVPALQTTWSLWRGLYPGTDALATTGSRLDPYSAYYAGPQAGVRGEERRDTRLPKKTVVMGAVLDDRPVAYPVDRVAEAGALDDTVADRGVLVVADRATGTTSLFDRSAGGRTPTFRVAAGDGADLVLRDVETGSLWLAWHGVAFDGPLAGTRLRRLPTTHAYWFVWNDFHPHTEVRGASE